MKNPGLLDVLESHTANERLDIHTALPARVVSFNGHTATVELMILQVMRDGQSVPVPPLVDVIVQFPRAGGFCFTVPVKPGDEGLAVFSERCIDGWYVSGNQSAPLDSRFHDYSDAFFIPGVCSVPNKLPDYFDGGASMQTDDGSTHIRLSAGKISIKGDIEHEGNSTSTGTVSAKKVLANGVDTENHTHSGVQTGSGNTGKPNK